MGDMEKIVEAAAFVSWQQHNDIYVHSTDLNTIA